MGFLGMSILKRPNKRRLTEQKCSSRLLATGQILTTGVVKLGNQPAALGGRGQAVGAAAAGRVWRAGSGYSRISMRSSSRVPPDSSGMRLGRL